VRRHPAAPPGGGGPAVVAGAGWGQRPPRRPCDRKRTMPRSLPAGGAGNAATRAAAPRPRPPDELVIHRLITLLR
jgi:hypothetical protein